MSVFQRTSHNDTVFHSPYGEQIITYADCTGSGMMDYDIDRYIERKVLPYYANTHSDSFCSDVMSSLIEKTRELIKNSCVNDANEYAVIFTGQGMTGTARHLAFLLHKKVVTIIYTSLEHVSNSSLWETVFPNASVRVARTMSSDPSIIDVEHVSGLLNTIVNSTESNGIVLVAFTACSNVLGCVQPVELLIRIIDGYRETAMSKNLHIVTCVDCAACAPYFALKPLCNNADAIMLSPHKFKGGQGTPGVLIVKRSIIESNVPFFPGGGTVWYKDQNVCNQFVPDIEHREEGGTPNIMGIIRTGILFNSKLQNQQNITTRIYHIVCFADQFFMDRPHLMEKTRLYTVIGKHQKARLPIYAFSVKDIHPGLFVKVLSDRYGIQSRSGVSCCYLLAEELCGINRNERSAILSGNGTPNKYGWVRVSFHYDFGISKIRYILQAVEELVNTIQGYVPYYRYMCQKNKWYHRYNDTTNNNVRSIVNDIFNDSYHVSSR